MLPTPLSFTQPLPSSWPAPDPSHLGSPHPAPLTYSTVSPENGLPHPKVVTPQPWVLSSHPRSLPRPPPLSATSRPSPGAGLREPSGPGWSLVGSTGAQAAWPPALPLGGPGIAGLWGAHAHPHRPFARGSRVGTCPQTKSTPGRTGPPVPAATDAAWDLRLALFKCPLQLSCET